MTQSDDDSTRARVLDLIAEKGPVSAAQLAKVLSLTPAAVRRHITALEDAEQIENFIPQGGGDVATGHRCPGEKIAVTALSVTISGLCTPGVEIDPKGLDFSWTQLPTMPGNGARVRVTRQA